VSILRLLVHSIYSATLFIHTFCPYPTKEENVHTRMYQQQTIDQQVVIDTKTREEAAAKKEEQEEAAAKRAKGDMFMILAALLGSALVVTVAGCQFPFFRPATDTHVVCVQFAASWLNLKFTESPVCYLFFPFLKRLKAIDLKKGRIRHIRRAKSRALPFDPNPVK